MSATQLDVLKSHGISPSAQRLAVAEYVLKTSEHPSADEVWGRVQARFPMVSRATVYNTLNLFVEKGLLRPLALAVGRVVFDPVITPHHHLVDEQTGEIIDIPWDCLKVEDIDQLDGFEISEYQVVLRGKRRDKT